MEKYTTEQRIKIIGFYFENQKSINLTQQAYCSHFKARTGPSETVINSLVQKFQEQGAVNGEEILETSSKRRSAKPAAPIKKASEIPQKRGRSKNISSVEETTVEEAPKLVKKGRGKKSKTIESIPESKEDEVVQDDEESDKKSKLEPEPSKENGEKALIENGSDEPETNNVKKQKKEKETKTTEKESKTSAKGGRGKKKKEVQEVEEVTETIASVPENSQKVGRGRKRGKTEESINKGVEEINVETEPSPKKKSKNTVETPVSIEKATKSKPATKKKVKANETETKYDPKDFELDEEYTFKISSWNVAGLRSWINKGGLNYITYEKPDIFCLQETKCSEDMIPEEARIEGYHPYWYCKPGGYAGIAIYSKKMPFNVEYGIGDEEQDADARIMTAEYEKFYLVNVYVPNAGRKLVTLPKRMRWNNIFNEYVTKLNKTKPVIICGDMNVAHQEIDLANPKTNKKNAGFTQEERDDMTKLLSLGFIDTFRYLYPNTKAYTFWTYMMNARSKNVGWRLDYFLISEKLIKKVVENSIRSKVMGSDHCPITLFLNI